MAFALGLGLGWHHASTFFPLTLYGLNLGTNLHGLFVKASWYSSELLGISGQLLGIPWIRSASVHHFITLYGLNFGMIFLAKLL